jgi:hypothetical protein
MSKLIISLEELYCNIFKNVAVSFSGTYTSDNKDMEDIKNEILFSPTPSIHQDRINLKKDASNVASDYRKAYQERKEEYSK